MDKKLQQFIARIMEVMNDKFHGEITLKIQAGVVQEWFINKRERPD